MHCVPVERTASHVDSYVLLSMATVWLVYYTMSRKTSAIDMVTDSLGISGLFSSVKIHYGLVAIPVPPSHLRLMQSADTFRRHLKTFLFHQAFLS